MKPHLPPPDPDESDARRVERLWEFRLALEQFWKLRPTPSGELSDALPLSPRARVATALLAMTGLAQRGWRNACAPGLRELTFTFRDLPAPLRGLRILHLSDLHYPPAAADFARGITDLVSGVEADICVLTGDYRFGRRMDPDRAMDHVAELVSRIRVPQGIFAVLGNHDLGQMAENLRAMGVRVLVNQGTGIDIGGAPFWLAGVDDPHMFTCAHPRAAMAGAPQEAFILFLAHAPEVAMEAADLGADLYLCGHTHAGQVRVPRWGALYANARCPKAYTAGTWRHGEMHGYTSPGLGVTEVPVRFNCPPEAAVITLQTEAGGATAS